MLERRINDRAFIGLIRKWLKAGVLELGATQVEDSELGTPQGGIISPILANIYLHHVLDLWIEKVVKKKSKGQVIFMRYADDSAPGKGARKMREGPSQSACGGRLQTAVSGLGKEPWS